MRIGDIVEFDHDSRKGIGIIVSTDDEGWGVRQLVLHEPLNYTVELHDLFVRKTRCYYYDDLYWYIGKSVIKTYKGGR